MILPRALVCVLLLCSAAPIAAFAEVLALFGDGGDPLADWSERSFSGTTRYTPIPTAEVPTVEAVADGSASGRTLEIELDLERWRWLAWSWAVDAPIPVSDVRERDGDDFAARVYLVFSGGWAAWRTTSLVYVWGPDDAPSGSWPNPFTSQARMIAVSRGEDAGWIPVRRDVVRDYEAAFGRPPPALVGVAIMTDTDQTGAAARARYANLRFETDTEVTVQSGN